NQAQHDLGQPTKVCLGQKRIVRHVQLMSALPPKSRHSSRQAARPLRAKSAANVGGLAVDCDLFQPFPKQLWGYQRHWPMVQLQKSAGRRLAGVRSSKGTRLKMLIRQLTVASLLSLAVISPGSTQAAKAPLLSARPTPKEYAPALFRAVAK